MAICKQCGEEYSILTAELGTGLCNKCLKDQQTAQKEAYNRHLEDEAKTKADKGLSLQELIEINKKQLYWLRFIGLTILASWVIPHFSDIVREFFR